MKKNLTYLDFETAFDKSLEIITPTQKKELVFILNALGKVVSKDIVSIKNLPSFNNSAMDGIACNLEDIKNNLQIVDTIFAGDKKAFKPLAKNECYKIMTGAKVPDGVNTIIPVENCEFLTNNQVKVLSNAKLNDNIRFKGEEIKKNSVIIKKGEKITSSHIALLSSQGINMVEVYQDIKIAVISTGNELKEPWEIANEDEIYNCNANAIISFLKENNFTASYCGVVPDNFEQSVEFIANLKEFDLIITSGGVSMGEADFLAEAFLKSDLNIAYHGINLKPGKAMMVGKMINSLVVALPGNPLAALVNCYLFLLPMAKKLQGETYYYHDYISCKNIKEFKVKENRVEVVLGKVENSNFCVTKDNKYGSGMISAVFESNAFMVSSGKTNKINQSSLIKVVEFNSKFCLKKSDFIN